MSSLYIDYIRDANEKPTRDLAVLNSGGATTRPRLESKRRADREIKKLWSDLDDGVISPAEFLQKASTWASDSFILASYDLHSNTKQIFLDRLCLGQQWTTLFLLEDQEEEESVPDLGDLLEVEETELDRPRRFQVRFEFIFIKSFSI